MDGKQVVCEHCNQEYTRLYSNGVPRATQDPHCSKCSFCGAIEKSTLGKVRRNRRGEEPAFFYYCVACESVDE